MNFIFDNNTPIYLQLVKQLKIHIVSGKLKPGERLPSVRDLSLELKVNPNTLQKSLFELEEMGLIFTERTNGKFVTGDSQLIEKYRKEYAHLLCQDFVLSMQELGFSKDETIHYLENGGN
ncbi:MAG: GntR family transcriptional regulator [Ruminococcaceae bacterium]|nr:GntR family transcriptional regulator [Oscillospiraceae bacterium]